MKLTESTSKELSAEQITSLRSSVGWNRIRSEEKWQEILSKSSFVYSVWDNNKLIGMGRLLEDGIMCNIYDVVVHQDYQGRGIGKMVLNNLLDYTKDKNYTLISIFAQPENKDFLIPFYQKFGFKLTDTGMVIWK